MKLLNIGCGSTFHTSWTNIDVSPSAPDVQSYDLRKGLPYSDNCFDSCYSSHVIEHLTKGEAKKFLTETLRILKPQGIIRVVVPDLESIARKYLDLLEQVESGFTEAESNYDWIMLELYDQTIRNFSGGEMGHYLTNFNLKNKDFILSRIGFEAETYWEQQKNIYKKSIWNKIKSKNLIWFIEKFRTSLAKNLVTVVAGVEARRAFEESLFRNSGEIHRWMYDRFSLKRMLERSGFIEVGTCSADKSRIPDFNSYNLDVIGGKVRKPDSLFMEGIKP